MFFYTYLQSHSIPLQPQYWQDKLEVTPVTLPSQMANSYRNLPGGLKEKTNPSCNKENLVRHYEKLFQQDNSQSRRRPMSNLLRERGWIRNH